MREPFLKTIGGVALAILLSMFAPVWVSAQDKGNEGQSDEQTQEDSSKGRGNAGALEGTWD